MNKFFKINSKRTYANFYSEFADTLPGKTTQIPKAVDKVKAEQILAAKSEPKTVSDIPTSSSAASVATSTNTSSFNLLDSIFSSQNLLFKDSNKIEIQK